MKTAKEHYDTHLAAVYEWLAGGFETAAERSRDFFRRLEIEKLPRGEAVDLGAGSGFQSVPLAELGFSVLAIDFSAPLLKCLEERKGNHAIRPIVDDLLNFTKYLNGEKARLIVCMGDTLTHLKSFGDVQKLLTRAAESLTDDGVLILTFRDYFSGELKGTERFIPVRCDDERIFTCFLEYFENRIEVHDLLYTKMEAGWKLSAGSYPKLRLDPQRVVEELKNLKMASVSQNFESGMVEIAARKSL